MQIREGWVLGFGAVLGFVAALIGLLIILNVAPDNPLDVGVALVCAGLSRAVP